MAGANDVHGQVYRDGTVTNLARLVGHDGVALVQADFELGSSSSSSGDCGPALSYSIHLLDDQDADSRTAVAGHTDVVLDEDDVIFDTLQDDAMWTVDSVGYNFRHTIVVCNAPAFAIAGRRYLVEYKLWPSLGQVIIARFFVNVI